MVCLVCDAHIGLLLVIYFGVYRAIRFPYLSKSIKGLILSFIIFSGVLAMFTNVDWDGRFLMGLLPILFCFGSMGLVKKTGLF